MVIYFSIYTEGIQYKQMLSEYKPEVRWFSVVMRNSKSKDALEFLKVQVITKAIYSGSMQPNEKWRECREKIRATCYAFCFLHVGVTKKAMHG